MTALLDPRIAVRLPGMNGMELLERLRDTSGGSPTVIIITRHDDVPMAAAARRAGAFHSVEKPFDPEALPTIIQVALERVDKLADEQSRIDALAGRRATLTPREQQALALLVDGLPTKLIAHQLGISTRTAEHHRLAVMKKMTARRLSQLVRMALDLQLAAPLAECSSPSNSG